MSETGVTTAFPGPAAQAGASIDVMTNGIEIIDNSGTGGATLFFTG